MPENHYSFRAECMVDVLRFLQKLAGMGHTVRSFAARSVGGLPDMACAVETDAWLTAAQSIAKQCEDCHRIAETLHPVA